MKKNYFKYYDEINASEGRQIEESKRIYNNFNQ